MFNEFILYAALLGAVSFGVVWFFTKDTGLGGIASIILGIVFILFVFPEPEQVKGLTGLINNLTLILIKVIWAAGWLGGTYGAYKLVNSFKP